MTNEEILAGLSIALSLSSSVVYVSAILKRQIKPHLFSWLIWAIETGTIAVAQYSVGAGAGSWPYMFGCFACGLTAVLALFYGEKNITKSDWFFFLAALAAIPLWIVTSTPLWSVLLVTLIDGLAYFPTFRKSYSDPWHENSTSFALSGVAQGLSVLAIETYSFTAAVYPVVFFIVNCVFAAALVYWRRQRRPSYVL